MSINLREDRYSPDHLPALEELRWKTILKYRAFIKGPNMDMFNMFPADGYCYGYKGKELVCFHYDGEGLVTNSLRESSEDLAHLFVRCLPENQVARYINSINKKVQVAVKERLQGIAKPPILFRQDIIDKYYKNEKVSGRLLKVIGYVDCIIKVHMQTLNRKIPARFRYYNHVQTLTINGRTYLQRGEIYLPPETSIWSFTPEDLESEEVVDVDHQFKYHITITGGTHDKTT